MEQGSDPSAIIRRSEMRENLYSRIKNPGRGRDCDRQRQTINDDVRRHVDESMTVGLAAIERDTRLLEAILSCPLDDVIATLTVERFSYLAELAVRAHHLAELAMDAHGALRALTPPTGALGVCTR